MKLKHPLVNLLGKKLKDIESSTEYLEHFGSCKINQIGDVYTIVNKQIGIDIILNNNKAVTAVHIYSGVDSDFKVYSKKLPQDLQFHDTIDSAHKKIGLSQFEAGGGVELPFLGFVKRGRKYVFTNCHLHLEFNEDPESISMITLSVK